LLIIEVLLERFVISKSALISLNKLKGCHHVHKMCTTDTPKLNVKKYRSSKAGKTTKENNLEAFIHSNKVLRNKSLGHEPILTKAL